MPTPGPETYHSVLESAAIEFMYLVSQETKMFELRPGDSRLASLDHLVPDFYEIFTRSVDLAYMRRWGMLETIVVIAPFAVMFLLAFLILASRAAQVALDLLVSLSVSCSHVWQHGLHLSQAASDGPSHRLLSPPLRLLRWLDGTDKCVEKAWDVMRLAKPDTKAEMLRQLSCTVRRIRDEKALLHNRRSLVKEAQVEHR